MLYLIEVNYENILDRSTELCILFKWSISCIRDCRVPFLRKLSSFVCISKVNGLEEVKLLSIE